MNWKQKGMIVALIGAAAGAAIGGIAYWWKDYPVHHFAVVRDGVLYRSGQPDPGQLRRLVVRYGIRTIVNLRGRRPDELWWRAETAFCHRRGLNLANIEMSEGSLVEANIIEFLGIVSDPANRPVLVHCEYGSARTGFAVAAYRIALEGWSFEKAVEEALDFHFKTGGLTNQEYQLILRRLAEGSGSHGNRRGAAPSGGAAPASRANGA